MGLLFFTKTEVVFNEEIQGIVLPRASSLCLLTTSTSPLSRGRWHMSRLFLFLLNSQATCSVPLSYTSVTHPDIALSSSSKFVIQVVDLSSGCKFLGHQCPIPPAPISFQVLGLKVSGPNACFLSHPRIVGRVNNTSQPKPQCPWYLFHFYFKIWSLPVFFFFFSPI